MRGILASVLAAVLAGEAAGAPLDHETLVCVPKDGNARVVVRLGSPAPVESVRVYFVAVEKKDEGWYYIELRERAETPGEYYGFLPIPKGETKRVEYRVVAKDLEGRESTAPAQPPEGTYDIEVKGDCAVPPTEDEKRFTENLVIGQTKLRQTTVPPGFECKGIIAEINVAGELRPNVECQRIPPYIWLAAGAAAAGLGTVIVTNTGEPPAPPPPISPFRPGPRQTGN